MSTSMRIFFYHELRMSSKPCDQSTMKKLVCVNWPGFHVRLLRCDNIYNECGVFKGQHKKQSVGV